MDLIKQYITQSIAAASNNLRLSTQKIEVVALLRESLTKSSNLENDIKEMKKITELSKFAIRLHEIYNYLNQPYIDFFKISDKFKEHSQYLIRDLSNMLEAVNPVSFKLSLDKIHHCEQPEMVPADPGVIPEIDLSSRGSFTDAFETPESETGNEEHSEKFLEFEKKILSPVKPLDDFIQKMMPGNFNGDELMGFIDIVRKNAGLAADEGFEIISEMHLIILHGLEMLAAGKIIPDKETTESIRACLIVIVAVVKGKQIDISGYLERAELFGNEIKNLI